MICYYSQGQQVTQKNPLGVTHTHSFYLSGFGVLDGQQLLWLERQDRRTWSLWHLASESVGFLQPQWESYFLVSPFHAQTSVSADTSEAAQWEVGTAEPGVLGLGLGLGKYIHQDVRCEKIHFFTCWALKLWDIWACEPVQVTLEDEIRSANS